MAEAEHRFPSLKGRLTTMLIAGGVTTGTFRNPAVSGEIRRIIEGMLALSKIAP